MINMANTSRLAKERSSVPQGGLLYTDQNVSFEDATWILTSAFIVFTMQSGFGLIESGELLIS